VSIVERQIRERRRRSGGKMFLIMRAGRCRDCCCTSSINHLRDKRLPQLIVDDADVIDAPLMIMANGYVPISVTYSVYGYFVCRQPRKHANKVYACKPVVRSKTN
jgi:hypothetical protein